jgi:DNA polymerase IV
MSLVVTLCQQPNCSARLRSLLYDYQKGSILDLGREIKKRIRNEIGEWLLCSIGISTNRFLAKLAASLHKPDGLDVIDHTNILDVYKRVKLLDLNGINTRFQARLNAYGIFTPMEFYQAPMDKLKKRNASKVTLCL